MDPMQALSTVFEATGRRLSARIAAVWPRLEQDQREAIEAERTEDGMRALLDAYEAGLPQPVHRTVFQVEVFSSGPYTLPHHTDWLPAIHHDITDGPCIGQVEELETTTIPPQLLRGHLIRIGNDGTFFDPIPGPDDEEPADSEEPM